ncbi:hypothetical protein B4U80_14412, partial [Leptotrombidium deliense]
MIFSAAFNNKTIPGPGKVPLLGSLSIVFFFISNFRNKNFTTITYELFDRLEEKYREFGIISLKLFGVSINLVTKPDLIKFFFKNYNSFSKQNYVLQKGELFIPNTLLVASPNYWRLKRKFYSP